MRDISFEISKEAIEQGVTKNSNHCMIAESLKAAYPHFRFVAADIQTIRATDPTQGVRHIWITPRTVQRLIIDFDQGKKPKAIREVRLQRGMEIPSGRGDNTTRKKKSAKGAKARLVRKSGGNGRSVPVIKGGKAPPRSVGARRAFGLRAMTY